MLALLASVKGRKGTRASGRICVSLSKSVIPIAAVAGLGMTTPCAGAIDQAGAAAAARKFAAGRPRVVTGGGSDAGRDTS